jgi:hypothetical protein
MLKISKISDTMQLPNSFVSRVLNYSPPPTNRRQTKYNTTEEKLGRHPVYMYNLESKESIWLLKTPQPVIKVPIAHYF